MRLSLLPLIPLATLLFAVPANSQPAPKNQGTWILLSTPDFEAWRGDPTKDWLNAGDVTLHPDNERKLLPEDGKGIIVNGLKGRAKNLLTKAKFGDLELHMEFVVPKGSNSGVKFHGHYEIQIKDSWGKKVATAHDCGGIYPRAELKPRYHHIDDGIPPKLNAALPPGQWQTLQAIFLAPRFDAKGKKIANARLLKVLLNGKLIHDNIELKTPTGNLWRRKEMIEGPLFLQGDHGPVAFRNVKVRSYMPTKTN